jgi:hypothetical protein
MGAPDLWGIPGETRVNMEVTLTIDMGGSDAKDAMNGSEIKLRETLKLLRGKQYSGEIERVRLPMMVSGRITDFSLTSEFSKPRRMKKERSINVDIVIAKDAWRGADQAKIRERLADLTLKIFEAITSRLKKEGIDIKDEELMMDLENILRTHYLIRE